MSAKSWFPYRKDGRGPEIFGVPHAGAGSTVFAGLRDAMARRGAALVPVVLPGRERRLRERPHDDMAALLDDFGRMADTADWAPFRGDYALLGHCSGALIAYEMARLLENAAHPPRLLVVSGSLPPPQVRDTGTNALSTQDLFARTAELGGTPGALLTDPDFLDMIERPLRADWALYDHYVHHREPPLETSVLAVRGAGDAEIPARSMARWRDETTGEFSLLELAAGHWPLAGDGAVALAEAVLPALQRAMDRS